ncbi:MAG: hypothetical protein DCC66_02965 [Planctomycetota bacterium]|nr:MAG: hypothetical protein DCC66_02965 [Planctomycetota bacterium]
MSDTKSTKQTATGKLPSHVAYQVRDREGQKGFWTRIGTAWAHADGKGFNIQLEAAPLDGRVVLRVASEKKD